MNREKGKSMHREPHEQIQMLKSSWHVKNKQKYKKPSNYSSVEKHGTCGSKKSE